MASAEHFGTELEKILESHRIPNSLVLTAVASFYAYAFLTDMPVDVIWRQSAVGLGVFIILALCHRSMAIGVGALKLTAVGFLWFGFFGGLVFTTLSYGLCGVVGSLANALSRPNPQPYLPYAIVAALITPHAMVLLG